MALSMAAFLGFTDMALFGADCGIRPGSDDHAKDTIYRDIGVFQKEGDIDERYPVEVEGTLVALHAPIGSMIPAASCCPR